MDNNGPINPLLQQKYYIHVILDDFSHIVVTSPIISNNAKTAVKTHLHHCITKFGSPIYLVTDRHSPQTAYSPRTNGLVEVQNRNLCTHLHMFLHSTPKDWPFQLHKNPYVTIHNLFHNSKILLMKLFSTHDH